ncbi:hypothetical protein [Pseudooceanicola sp. LIPI14-2-Ac024]
MTRVHFLILATLALCTLPVIGTLVDSHPPQRAIALTPDIQLRHY